MKKTKLLALGLSAAMLIGLCVPVAAVGEGGTTTPATSGMEVKKTAVYNESTKDYTITLEAYATGRTVVSEERVGVPTDVVLVLDQSTSMSNVMGALAYTEYNSSSSRNENYGANSNLYDKRHNGGSENLWYKLNNSTFVSVSVVREQRAIYQELSSIKNSDYYSYRNNLYEKVGDSYEKVSMSRSGGPISGYAYTYTFADGTELKSSGASTVPSFGTHAPLYRLTGTDYVYSYYYTDTEGKQVEIGTSTGNNTIFTYGDGQYLYRQYTDSSATRMQVLSSAATQFINDVSAKAKADKVDHRVAVVGFASTGASYKNTELLSTSRAVNYENAEISDYKDALVSVNDANGNVNSRLTTAISRLETSGDTYLEYGMDMANKIFENNAIAEDDTSGRQRVVIVFTDGYPAPSGSNTFTYSMADNAIRNAKTAKQEYGATVYTIAVLKDADPTASITTGFTYGGTSSTQQTVAVNRYLHYVSSNYPKAEDMQNGGDLNENVDPFVKDGESYYLVAGDSADLTTIFEKIADKIEGGSSSTLNAGSVVRDIVSPQFTLPDGAKVENITLETYQCTGKVDDKYTWEKNDDAMGAEATIDKTNGNDRVNVTGFDFSANWVGTSTTGTGTTYRGNKLVIKFNVVPRDGFLGGNNVYTNTSAGIYVDDMAATPTVSFDRPEVNVEIGEIVVTPADSNVYLGGHYSETIPADQIKASTKVTVGGVELDLNEPNYGLEDWQTEYVDVIVKVTDASGNEVTTTGIEGLTEDTEFTVTVTVKPKGEAKDTSSGPENPVDGVTGDGTNIVYVFKPELTFKDSTVWYGAAAPEDYTGNLTLTRWVHTTNGEVDKVSTDMNVEMLGDVPTLSLTYTPDADKISGGKINSKQDIPVDVTVKIGSWDVTQYVRFVHTDCKDRICTVPEGQEFLLHVNTCQLTITKKGGEEGGSYIFAVYKDGAKYTEITITGNGSVTLYELPVGTYTIKEDTGWSWRYTPTYTSAVTLSDATDSGSITCTNTSKNDKWLNDFSVIVRNIFGKKKEN